MSATTEKTGMKRSRSCSSRTGEDEPLIDPLCRSPRLSLISDRRAASSLALERPSSPPAGAAPHPSSSPSSSSLTASLRALLEEKNLISPLRTARRSKNESEAGREFEGLLGDRAAENTTKAEFVADTGRGSNEHSTRSADARRIDVLLELEKRVHCWVTGEEDEEGQIMRNDQATWHLGKMIGCAKVCSRLAADCQIEVREMRERVPDPLVVVVWKDVVRNGVLNESNMIDARTQG
eukprot:CAMPEP_0113545114 /NCGR_PEP_ID=MMETSP0015_2-20120614/11082_1 /TAXON_ID=2838 /ORGANISM="Odontella" /LENGTH=236 /DNA_ID=CAMNT_0000445445 /DNA_START=534 /DNA_END=1245 /DNA_ORIENTATION=+ /assembly_acc=CAM_ASM_000160